MSEWLSPAVTFLALLVLGSGNLASDEVAKIHGASVSRSAAPCLDSCLAAIDSNLLARSSACGLCTGKRFKKPQF